MEANRIGDRVPFGTIPIVVSGASRDGDYSVRDSAYLHYINNTLFGTQFHHLPDSGGKPRVVDASSDICSAKIDVSGDLIYAGAQKNLG